MTAMRGYRSKPYEKRNRLRDFLLGNLGALAICALVMLAPFLFFYRPDQINRSFPVDLPGGRAVGVMGEALASEGLELRVNNLKRVPSEQFDNLNVTSRSRPDKATDYVVLFLEITNTSSEPTPLSYDSLESNMEFLLGARRPTPDVMLAAFPRDAETITGEAALPSRALEPGETVQGTLVFPTNQAAKELSLLVVPNRYRSIEGTVSTFEVALDEE